MYYWEEMAIFKNKIDYFKNKSNTICPLPWIHVTTSPMGAFRPCCNTQLKLEHDGKRVDMRDGETFESVLHGPAMDKLRQQMLDGERPSVCEPCYEVEDLGVKSYRQNYIENFSDIVEFENEEPISVLRYFDLKFDTTCNFRCRMCDPGSSNQIWEDIKILDYQRKHHFASKSILPVNWESYDLKDKDKEKFFQEEKYQDVLNNIEHLRVLKCTGGEPFISKHFLSILEEAVKRDVAKNIELKLTTNGSKFFKPMLLILDKFKKVKLNISIDGVGSTYDYMRFPFKWNKFDSRMNELLEHISNTEDPNKYNVQWSFLATALNYLDTANVVSKYSEYKERYPALEYVMNTNWIDVNLNMNPYDSELHIKYLPQHILQEGLERCKSKNLPQNILEDIESFVNRINVDNKEVDNKNRRLKISTFSVDTARKLDHAKHIDPIVTKWLSNV